MIAMCFVIKTVDAEHGYIYMGILHSAIFPVSKLQSFCAILFLVKQKIIRHCINMGKAPLLSGLFNVVFQGKDMLLRCFIIMEYGFFVTKD